MFSCNPSLKFFLSFERGYQKSQLRPFGDAASKRRLCRYDKRHRQYERPSVTTCPYARGPILDHTRRITTWTSFHLPSSLIPLIHCCIHGALTLSNPIEPLPFPQFDMQFRGARLSPWRRLLTTVVPLIVHQGGTTMSGQGGVRRAGVKHRYRAPNPGQYY